MKVSPRSPVYNHATQGDLFGRMLFNGRCRTHMGILDLLFDRMRDPKVRSIFQRWAGEEAHPIPV